MPEVIIESPLVADLEIITVKSNLPEEQAYQTSGDMLHLQPTGGHPVALWEKHPAHPAGEVLVSGSRPVRVARTERVVEKLRAEELVQVADATEPVSELAG
jgi:hypothetical protein